MSDTPTKTALPAVSLVLEQPTQILVRDSGETKQILDLSDPELASALGKAKILKELLEAKVDDLKIEALARMDRRARWTLEDGPVRLEGGSPAAAVDYSAEGLRAGLDRLVEKGELSPEAADAAVDFETPAPKLKVRKKGIDALLKLGDAAVAGAIDDAKTPKKRTVSVKLSDPEAIR